MGRSLLVVMAIALGISGCVAERRVLTDPASARYELRDWPRGSVTVAVEDTRTRRNGDSERLTSVVKTVVNDALATAERPASAPEQLRIAIRDHEVYLNGRHWDGFAHLRAELIRNGRLLKSWEAYGEDRRWDRRIFQLPSFEDAEDSLHRAFERALDDLMAKLSRRPSP